MMDSTKAISPLSKVRYLSLAYDHRSYEVLLSAKIPMGTFQGHLVPGLAITLLGLWHACNTIHAYHLKGSGRYMSRFWYPFNSPIHGLKYLELILILSFAILAIIMQVLDFPLLNVSFKLDSFEHSTMFLHLGIFAVFTFISELSHSAEALSGLVGILAASVFGQELFLLHYHSADHVGLEGHYHWLLQLIVFVSFVAALATTSFPTSFLAALVLAISVIFQGCWFMNMGFMLWVPQFIPRGCIAQLAEPNGDKTLGAVMCMTHEAGLRAKALANLQFSWILAGILVFTGCTCLRLAGKCSLRCQSTEYEQLHAKGSEVGRMPLAIDGINFKQMYP